MNFLNVFEQRVGGLFGAGARGLSAPFSFKKLAKKAAREMEAETFVIDGVDTAPGLFTILVSSDDDLAMRPLYAELTHETAQFIEGQAQNKGYVFVGKPVVRFMADPSLKSGRFSVFAENVDAQTLNRLREEEAKFIGAESSMGLGGAARPMAEAAQERAAAPVPSAAAAGIPAGPMRVSNMAAEGFEAGLDVLPQEAVYDAEEAARAGAARQQQNVPLVSARARTAAAGVAPSPAPQQPQQPAYAPEQRFISREDSIRQQAQQAAPQQYAPSPEPPVRLAGQVPPVSMPDNPLDALSAPAAAGMAAGAGMAAAGAAPARMPGAQAAAAVPATVRVASPAPAAPAATCLLIDRQSGRTYTATAPRTVIGRERTPGGVVLHDPNVSRAHAELTYTGSEWVIRDLRSTNGTLVNDIDVDSCALRSGDLITLGLVTLEFRES